MDSTVEYPEWMLDVMRTKQDMMYGRIPVELVISGNQVTKVVGTKMKQTKFRNNDEAKIYVLDQINAGTVNGTQTISVIKKNGNITQVNTFEQIEYNY